MKQRRAHTCGFCSKHDLKNDVPIGPQCGKPATHEIYWNDGRVSPACDDHGVKVLDDESRARVKAVKRPVREEEWATDG